MTPGHSILATAMPVLLATAAAATLAATMLIRLCFRPLRDHLGRRRR